MKGVFLVVGSGIGCVLRVLAWIGEIEKLKYPSLFRFSVRCNVQGARCKNGVEETFNSHLQERTTRLTADGKCHRDKFFFVDPKQCITSRRSNQGCESTDVP